MWIPCHATTSGRAGVCCLAQHTCGQPGSRWYGLGAVCDSAGSRHPRPRAAPTIQLGCHCWADTLGTKPPALHGLRDNSLTSMYLRAATQDCVGHYHTARRQAVRKILQHRGQHLHVKQPQGQKAQVGSCTSLGTCLRDRAGGASGHYICNRQLLQASRPVQISLAQSAMRDA
jgi:hypothetical protein